MTKFVLSCLAALALLGGCSSAPKYPGDRTEMRACRWCSGTGVESADAYEGPPPPGVTPGGPCVGCRGAKNLSVIIPGPKHPAWVKGTVRDGSKVRAMPVEALLLENQRPMQPVLGAVAGAKLHFEGGSRALDIVSNGTGRFKLLLEPGHYKVHISAPGFPDRDEALEVAPRKEPIWQERAKLVTPEGTADETTFDVVLGG